jgi:hypothetical protein
MSFLKSSDLELVNIILVSSANRIGLDFFIDHLCKSKAVPLHAMKALGGRGGIAPTHSRPWH